MECMLWIILFPILNAGAQLFISPSDQSALNNGVAVITCFCNSSSCTSITWMRNGRKVTNDNPRLKVTSSDDNRMSTLRVHPVRWRLDDGIYSCSMEGGASAVAKISIHGTNDVPSDFPQLLNNIPQMEVTSEGVLVTCPSTGDSSITWFKDFLPVTSSTALSNNSLLVTDIPQDGVKIECQVSNHRGSIMSSHLSINSSVGTPTNLTLVLIEGAGNVTWKVPEFLKDVLHYMVEYGDDDDPFEQEILSGNTQQFISAILEKGTEYKFMISSKTVLGWSDKAVAKIKTPDAIPLGSPLNITATEMGSESFKLNWTPPQLKLRKGKIIAYEIRERADDKIVDWTVNSTETFYVIRNLQAQQSYSFQIRAYTLAGPGPWSSYIQIYTKPQSSLQPPRAIKLHRLSPSELEVSWQAVPSNEPITYEIFATIHATSDLSEWQKRATTSISIVFENAYSSSYAVRIRSVLPSGKFSELSKVVVETSSYFPDKYQPIGVGVRNFVVYLLRRGDHQDATLEWYPPDNIKFNHYQISYDGSKYYIDENNSKKEFIHKKTKKVDKTQSKVKVENLHPGTLYKFIISSCYAENICGTSQTTLLNTEPRIPPPPEAPQIMKSEQEFSVKLRPVSGINGVIIKYFLVFVKSSLIESKTPMDFTNEEIIPNIERNDGDVKNLSVTAFEFRTLPVRFVINKLSIEQNYVTFLRAFIDNNTFVSSEYSTPFNFISIKLPTKEAGNINSKLLFTIIPAFIFVVVLVTLMVSCYRHKARETKKYKEFLKDEHVSMQSEKFISETTNFNKPSPPILKDSTTCRPVNLKNIGNVLAELQMNEGMKLRKEYESIDPNKQFTWESSTKEENKSKNRYANVVAYDHTSVKITNDITGSDYINANYIDGYCKTRTYIATQGPMNNTIADFWRMVWEQESDVIVMLANIMERGRIKCDQYWPQTTELYGLIYVALTDTVTFSTYAIRTFQITNINTLEKRGCTQYQFTAWPDQGTPSNPSNFLNFVKRIKNSGHLRSTPLVVHCSAGVGRTGVFIGVDAILEQMEYEEVIDICAYVTLMRSQRNYMVQTEDQYKFLYEVINEEVQYGDCDVTADRFLLRLNQIFAPLHSRYANSEVQMEYKKLQTLLATSNQKKVRSLMLDEENKYGILQEEFPDYAMDSCLVNSFKVRRAFITTESPQPSTTDDFWRMVWNINCTIIVMIENIKDNINHHRYWPEGRSMRYKYFVLDPLAQYNMPVFTLREFKMTDARDGQSRVVRHFHFTDWSDCDVPKSGESFIEFIGQIQKTKQQFGLEGPVAIHCSQGDDKTGIFMAVSNVLERLQCEGIINIFQSIRSIHSQKPFFNVSEEQYRFCYQAVMEYLSSFDHLIS